MQTVERTDPFPITPNTAGKDAGAGEYLSFCLGGGHYGIDILKVQEIRGYEKPTRMTGSPDFVNGVLNLRGVIVPIVDLRRMLGMPNPSYDALTVTVILALERSVVGVVVDSVSDVLELEPHQIKRVPDYSGYIDSRCVTGIGSIGSAERERMLILLNIERLMHGNTGAIESQTLQ